MVGGLGIRELQSQKAFGILAVNGQIVETLVFRCVHDILRVPSGVWNSQALCGGLTSGNVQSDIGSRVAFATGRIMRLSK